MKLAIATNNKHKLTEIRAILDGCFDELLSLGDLGIDVDIEETGATLEENALIKAREIVRHTNMPALADDTGLMVDALGGAPGVYSARYAGDGHDSQANMSLLLKNMEGVANRAARFRTVIALVQGNEVHLFEGVVEGSITTSPAGCGGFGYDPVFKPAESDVTFAEMDADAKNAISHRGRATARLMDYLLKK